jgi:hypothetical protein
VSEELERRLREGRLVRQSRTMTSTLDGMPIEVQTGDTRELPHPDAIEAADTLKRYREALEGIAKLTVKQQLPITSQIHECAMKALTP